MTSHRAAQRWAERKAWTGIARFRVCFSKVSIFRKLALGVNRKADGSPCIERLTRVEQMTVHVSRLNRIQFVKLSFQGSLVITLPVDIINLELQRDMRGIRPHGSMAFGVEWSKKTQ